MNRVEILLSPVAARQMEALPEVIQVRVQAILERLRQWPQVSGAKPLSGKLARRFRMRTGDYRVQFRLQTGNVIVERIGHRDGFYED
jgi:mRNA-degrading endonuclease RelE of RelBE toxin-antitoxin system